MLRFLWIVLAIAAAAVLMPIGIANRQPVTLNLDPFGRAVSPLAIDLPLSLLLFLVLLAGLLLGGLATWLGQGKWRHAAREKSREAFTYKAQADRLAREIDPNATPENSGPRTRAARLAHGR